MFRNKSQYCVYFPEMSINELRTALVSDGTCDVDNVPSPSSMSRILTRLRRSGAINDLTCTGRINRTQNQGKNRRGHGHTNQNNSYRRLEKV